MSEKQYQDCTRSVMDTTDPEIQFDEDGVCDHCHDFELNTVPNWHPNEFGDTQLKTLVSKIKQKGASKEYDSILGMSGGLDSSYLLHKVVTEYGLRPLVFHVDAGWNSDVAVSNIEAIVSKLGIDLYVEVVDWADVRDFQLALFRSGIPSLDIAQDHAFFAVMYHFAQKHGIKYILNGGNHSTECCRNPLEWLYYGTDMRFVRDIRRRFCESPLENYPWSGIFYHKLYLRYLKGIQVIKPLNYMPYTKEIATKTLEEQYGWKPYPQKHFESRFTRFFEGYWLSTRFGYDMRRPQFSSLISTGQMTRDEALKALEELPYDAVTIDADLEFIANKLNITLSELDELHRMPLKSYKDYRNSHAIMTLGAKVLQFIGAEKQGLKR